MGFDASGPRIWPLPPDWRNGVQERLSWSTDALHASATAVSQHRGLYDTPRRRFTFELVDQARQFRAAQMLLAGHGGAWLLPVWPDVQWLSASVTAEAEIIPCKTEGFDFVAGGKALLYAGVNQWEVVEVDAIDPAFIALGGPTVEAFGKGCRLYPLRSARIEQGAQSRLRNAHTFRCSLAFDIDEACHWPALGAPTTYLGHPVQTTRPDAGDDPSAGFARMIEQVDLGGVAAYAYDLPGVALRMQADNWKLMGRAEQSAFRSLLYTLDGRRVPFWIPSWTDDLRPVATIAGGSTTLTVEWTGYTKFGLGKPNRRDLRIELVDGTVFYRRATAALDFGETEALTLNASLSGTGITAAQVRQVSIMALCTLAGDDVEINHVTDADGVATSRTGWEGVVPDV